MMASSTHDNKRRHERLKDRLMEVFRILNDSSKGHCELDEAQLESAFYSAFERYAVQTKESSKRDPISELLERFVYCSKRGYEFDLIAFQSHGPDAVACVLRADRFDKAFVMSYVAKARSNSRIVQLDRRAVKTHQKVSGEVRAEAVRRVHGFPNEDEMASTVRRLPREVGGKLLAQGTDLVPVREPKSVIRLILDSEQGNSDISIIGPRGESYSGGAFFTKIPVCVNNRSAFLLYDRATKPIACCVGDPDVRRTAYTIYGVHPILLSDESVFNVEGKGFYPWFRVRRAGRSTHRPIHCWNGSKFVPFLRVVSPESSFPVVGSKTTFARGKQRPVVIVDERDNVFGFLTHRVGYGAAAGRNWELTIFPGVDPAMMLCLSVVLDRTSGVLR